MLLLGAGSSSEEGLVNNRVSRSELVKRDCLLFITNMTQYMQDCVICVAMPGHARSYFDKNLSIGVHNLHATYSRDITTC